MTIKRYKAIIFAPFWRQEGHVGNNRVDRFVRWLAAAGYTVVMIRAGSTDGQQATSWGQEITVRDRLGLYRDTASGAATTTPSRKPNKLRRALAYWLFKPDPTVVWSRSAAKHSLVLQAMEGAAFILSSSPPESAHVGAWMLSRRTGVAHIVDMRDGWLDEPLKPLLRSSALRRWLEGRMEARILRDANTIQVTSDVWQELLNERLPELSSKVQVLTNGYPQYPSEPFPKETVGSQKELMLIHAGRFSGSDTRRTPDILLEPLLQNLSLQSGRGVIRLIGPLSSDELEVIESFKPRYQAIGWRFECSGRMPRERLLTLLPQADGLLLLSASHAAIPSKLFEYIATGRPIFAVTEKGSATWRVAEQLPQVTLSECAVENRVNLVSHSFYELRQYEIPHVFCEESLCRSFTKMCHETSIK